MPGLVQVTAPSAEPFTLDEAKLHLRINQDQTDEDGLIRGLIIAARRYSEKETRRAFITQTWDWFLDEFPKSNGPFVMPLPDLVSVTTLKYTDEDGAEQTLTAGVDYDVDATRTPGRIVAAFEVDWPTTRLHINVVEIRFVAGYGAPSKVPPDIKAAMKLLLGTWYGFREEIQGGTPLSQLPADASARRLLQAQRVLEL